MFYSLRLFFFKEETKQSVELLQKLFSRCFPVFLTLKGWLGFVKEGPVMHILQQWFSNYGTSASLCETWKHLQFEHFLRLACFANSALGTHFWNTHGEYIVTQHATKSLNQVTFLPLILVKIWGANTYGLGWLDGFLSLCYQRAIQTNVHYYSQRDRRRSSILQYYHTVSVWSE